MSTTTYSIDATSTGASDHVTTAITALETLTSFGRLSTTEIIVIASVSGVFGLVLIAGVVGFFFEQCGYLDDKKPKKPKTVTNVARNNETETVHEADYDVSAAGGLRAVEPDTSPPSYSGYTEPSGFHPQNTRASGLYGYEAVPFPSGMRTMESDGYPPELNHPPIRTVGNFQYRPNNIQSDVGFYQKEPNVDNFAVSLQYSEDNEGYFPKNDNITFRPAATAAAFQYANTAFTGTSDEKYRRPPTELPPVSYKRENKFLKPEKKPSAFHPQRNQSNYEQNSRHYAPIEISLDKEMISPPKPEVKQSSGVTVGLDSFDPQGLMKERNKKFAREGIRMVIPENLEIHYPTPEPLNLPTLQYENPKIEVRKRKEQILEEIRRKEAAKRNAKRIQLQSNDSEQNYPTADNTRYQTPKPKRQNSELDSFLF